MLSKTPLSYPCLNKMVNLLLDLGKHQNRWGQRGWPEQGRSWAIAGSGLLDKLIVFSREPYYTL
jgi:hypothetical protein